MYNSSNAVTIDLPVMEEEIKWNNKDNNAFYEAVKADGLRKLAEKGGLQTDCDMRALKTYWKDTRSILEVGAGYGRVINHLLKNGYSGHITAIERCRSLFTYLNQLYQHEVELFNLDVYTQNIFNKKYDLVFLLWGAICDFSPTEQPIIIKKLANFVQNQGKLIIDTIPANFAPLGAKKISERAFSLEVVNQAPIYVYLPTIDEIKHYAKKAGFFKVEHLICPTDTGRERWLFILS